MSGHAAKLKNTPPRCPSPRARGSPSNGPEACATAAGDTSARRAALSAAPAEPGPKGLPRPFGGAARARVGVGHTEGPGPSPGLCEPPPSTFCCGPAKHQAGLPGGARELDEPPKLTIGGQFRFRCSPPCACPRSATSSPRWPSGVGASRAAPASYRAAPCS